MTLAQIMTLALRQLDEDPEDISEYDELFRVYANMGYQIAATQYVKPRETRTYRADEHGAIRIDPDVRRVVELRRRMDAERIHRNTLFEVSPMGDCLLTAYPGAEFIAVCEVAPPPMETDTDEPTCLPPEAHAAIADYICFRHLSSGNMAKQSRAQFYERQFYQEMQRINPQGTGSVTGFSNLYAATDIRWTR